jgi:hypothetical protein
LTRQGYALTSEDMVGLPEKFRENFVQTYFTTGQIHQYPGDWPVDRKRARDVVRYWWRDDELSLREHGTIAITDPGRIMPRRRVYSRVRLLEDAPSEEFIRAVLSLVPPGRRKRTGTFGVNLFRTFTDVVTTPHHDHQELIILYVLDRQGEGAESYLYKPVDVSEGKAIGKPIMQRQLNPGDIFIFDDKRFMHGATPLEALPDGTAQRDVLVCTVDYRSTYLSMRAKFRALRGLVRSAVAARPQGDAGKQLSPAA